MVTYKPVELKNRIIENFKYLEDNFENIENILNIDDGLGFDLSELGYGYDDIDADIEITGDTIIYLELDETRDMDIYEEIKLSELFEIIDSYKSITKFTNDRCISKSQALFSEYFIF